MIIAVLKIFPFDENYDDVLDVLLSVKGPVLADPGCLTSCIYKELGEEESGILYIEQWRSMADLERHLRSSIYGRVLEAMELSSRHPQLNFYETGKRLGFELIEKVRTSDHQVSGNLQLNV